MNPSTPDPVAPGTAGAPVDPVLPFEMLALGKKVPADVTFLLEQDHEAAFALFDWFTEATEPAEKLLVAGKIWAAVSAHLTIEEELVYPAARDELGDDALVDQAVAEHAETRRLLDQIAAGMETGGIADATVLELQNAVRQHVLEEESELFPRLRQTDFDRYAMGAAVAARRLECLEVASGRKAGPTPH